MSHYTATRKIAFEAVVSAIKTGRIYLDGVNYTTAGKEPIVSYKTLSFATRKGLQTVIKILRDPNVISIQNFDKISYANSHEAFNGVIFVVNSEEIIKKYDLIGGLYIKVLNYESESPLIVIHDQWESAGYYH